MEQNTSERPLLGVQKINIRSAFGTHPAPLDFVLPGLLSGTVGVVVSPGGTGKSYLMLESAVGIGIGRDFNNLWGQTPHMGKVVYIAGEDPEEVITRRLYTIGQYINDMSEEDFAVDHVEVLPVYGRGFTIAAQVPNGGITPSESWIKFEEYLVKNPARLVILDTFNRLLGGISENDSGAMGAVLSIIEKTCRKTGAAVVLVHHTNKASMNGGASDQQAARGSSAITDNARWQVNLSTMDRDEAAARGIEDDEERRKWVRLDLSKVNYGPPISERWLRKGEFGELLQGDPPMKVGKQNKASRKARKSEDADDDRIPF